MGGIGQLGTLIPNELTLTTRAALTSTMVVGLIVAATVKRQENLLTPRNTIEVNEVTTMWGYGLLQKQGFGVVATAVDVVETSDTTFEFVAHFTSTATIANSANGVGANDMSTLAKCLSFAIRSVVAIMQVWALALCVALSMQRAYPTQPAVSIFTRTKGQVLLMELSVVALEVLKVLSLRQLH